MPKGSDHSAKSTPTGTYSPCPYWEVFHKSVPVACAVQKGPACFWIQCGICWTNVKIAPKLLKTKTATVVPGMTFEQAQASGFIPTA